MKVFALASLAAVALSVPALADSLTFSLAQSNAPTGIITLQPGASFTLSDAVGAPFSNQNSIFLNGDAFTIGGPVTLDDSPFFNNFPSTLAPGMGYAGQLLTLAALPSALPGSYSGSFSILGGSTDGTNNTLGTIRFTVVVPGNTSPVPEPATWLFLSTGLVGGAVLAFRR